MPHGHCFLWRPDLLFMHVGSDIIIFLSYFAIPLALLYYLSKKPLPIDSTIKLFALFIVCCGLTHIIGMVNIWHGFYHLEGVIKAITAIVSAITAIKVWRDLPSWLSAPSILELNKINNELKNELQISNLKSEELIQLREYLEQKVSDRTKALEAEIEQRSEIERNLNALIDTAALGLILVTPSGNIKRANKAACSIFENDDLVDINVSDLVAPHMKGSHQGWLNNYFKNQVSGSKNSMAFGREIDYHSPSGKNKKLNIELQDYVSKGEHYCLASITDNTVAAEATRKLNESEKKFRTIAESVDAVMWMSTPKISEILYVNPAYEMIWQQSCESLYSNPASLIDRVHPEDQPRVKQEIQQNIDKQWDLEYRILLKDQTIRYIRDKGIAVKNEYDDVIFLVGFAVDVTDQVRLSEIEDRYQLTINAINDGLYDWDIENNKVEASPQLKALHHLPEEAFWDYNVWAKGVHPDDLPFVEEQINNHLEGKTEQFEAEYRIINNNQEEWLLTRGQVVARNKDGKALRMLGIESNINRKKSDELKLKQMFEELKRKNQELDEFVYVASHDLKEPARGIQHLSQFLLEDYENVLEQEGIEYLNKISKSAVRLSLLIDSLLLYSRTGRRDIIREQINLEEIIDDLKLTLPQLKDVELTTDLQGAQICADKISVYEILQNLLSNSVKYTNKTPIKITVSVNQDGWLSVTDNGDGIEQDAIDSIFTIFQRLDHTKEGDGIGLSIVKKLVELHEGELKVESKLGQGTSISCKLNSELN